jgi:TonB family protein
MTTLLLRQPLYKSLNKPNELADKVSIETKMESGFTKNKTYFCSVNTCRIFSVLNSAKRGGKMRINFLLFTFIIMIIIGCSVSQTTQPVLISDNLPFYPLEAELEGIEGETKLSLKINGEGLVENVAVRKSSGSEILDDAAKQYARDLVFTPATLDGEPVDVWITWAVDFQLSRFGNINKPESNFKVLVFTKTEGFKHESIKDGLRALNKLAEDNMFDIDITSNSSMIKDKVMTNYQAVVFLNTSGDVLTKFEQNALRKFIQRGSGFVGIHGAVDTEYDWPWYGALVGAYFDDHPEVQPAAINIIDRNHVSTEDLPQKWQRTDEWYNLRSELPDNVQVLALLDESTYEGGKHGDYHPFSWYHEYDGGRAWVTLGGHTKESYSEELFLNHILGGIKYAAGVK